MFGNNIKKKIESETSKKINFNKSFNDNNLDSLDIITTISIIEDEFGFEIKEKSLKKISNFKSLYAFVKKNEK